MASKYQIIVGMAEHTARDITQNPDSWMSFLTTAASNYKYKFKDQILIHAQKPNATACAEIETWNRLGRWVNKGTKGIALLSDKDIPYRLRHVFDVSDTNTRVGAHISLWQMQDRYEEAVTEALENSFGEIEEKTGFASILLGTAKNAVEDNLSDYLSDLVIVKGDSYLDELDELNTEVWLKTALTNSVAFMLLTRCGMDARELIIFKHASELGNAASYKLFDAVTVKKVDGVAVPRKFSDYTVTVSEDLPEGVTCERLS